jgi:hypothetical protein
VADTNKRSEKERKDQEFHMRMTKSHLDILDMLSYEEDKTKSEVVTKALTFYYNFKYGSPDGPIV